MVLWTTSFILDGLNCLWNTEKNNIWKIDLSELKFVNEEKNPRGVNKHAVGGCIYLMWRAKHAEFSHLPLEYHDVYQIIGFSWVWFAFSTHFWLHFLTFSFHLVLYPSL